MVSEGCRGADRVHQRKSMMRTLVILALISLSFGASAGVFKCVDDGGAAAYSNKRCAADAIQVSPELTSHLGARAT